MSYSKLNLESDESFSAESRLQIQICHMYHNLTEKFESKLE